ncbi:PKD domain-containing protein, partial [Bacteriovoracaceae bacterium]|nr:PKD domain-containing protein [Bacteriovoracaceae bacterium]
SGFGESISQTTNQLTRSFPNAGTFSLQVEVIDSKGNTSVSSKNLTVKDILPPSINIAVSSTEIFQGESVEFNLSGSTKGTFPITSYELVVEGNTLSQNTPVFNYTFQNIGDINVVYKVKDERGLEASDNINIRVKEIIPVNQAPVASFTMSATEITVGDTVNFDASASSDDKGIVEYAWRFGANATKDVFTPQTSYTFMQAGTFEITLSVFDQEDLQSTPVTKTIIVNEDTSPEANPIAYFKFERAAELNDFGDEETFIFLEFYGQAGSTSLASAEYEVLQTGQKFTPRDLYPATGTEIEGLPFGIYDIKLTVTDQAGKTNSFIHNIVLNGDDQDPILDFELKQAASNTAFLNLLRSFDPVDFAFEFDINWGDGTSESLSDQLGSLHTYSSAGTYDVTITYNSPNVGTATTLTKQITVSEESLEPLFPIANFVKWQEDFAGHVRFYQELSLSPNGDLISFQWDFGDGSQGFGEEATHFYEPGVYLVKLTVTDQMGMRDSQTQRVVITEPGPSTLVGGDCWAEDTFGMCFAIALDDFEELTTMSIDWGDGAVDEFDASDSEKWYEIEEGHQYASQGDYNVVVTANTLRGQSVTFETTIDTSGGGGAQAPIADFYCYQNELVVECFNNSFDPDGFITTASLNMGDGTSYDAMSGYIVHEYQDAGEYTITLSVIDNENLESQSSQLVNVIGGVNILPLVTFSCEQNGLELSCTDTSVDTDGSIVERAWVVNGEVVSNGSVLTYSALEKGQFIVELSVTDNEGGMSTDSKAFFLSDDPSDVLVAKVICNEVSTLILSCHHQESSGNVLLSKWIINGELLFENTDVVLLKYSEDIDLNIKVELSNDFTSASSTIDYSLKYLSPNPDFNLVFNKNNTVKIHMNGLLKIIILQVGQYQIDFYR